ncbi:CaiB/BaiF CoA-transferase family protein [Labrenzia sp. PHM005]|uniref:CaiB/BaiF CoA transferase family protein n=1 Tax=Labrenzia sp. PHM005 TaxID=2590016 RepID=UPI0011404A91|nr:CoA transferase [Labrenzia sp. PHM005]QDG78852.1 CoA transferase [Labrenzia sp. PHM005]
MSEMSHWTPLKGVKIVDFSMLLPGPLTTLILGDLGAEIIKVEPPGGDYARHMKSHMFEGANRGKRSIVIDMKSPQAASVVEKLAAYGDVAIEGFRPGVASRLGFGPQQLQAVNPGLVYCSLSGFGQTGPAATKAGHDLAYLAMGGSLAYRGQLRQPPSRASLPIADIAGGAFAAVSILAALREGKGTTLDLSLYEAVLYTSALRFGFDTTADSVDHLYPANDLFTCSDGRLIALTVVEEKFWNNLVHVLKEIAPALSGEEFATEAGRLRNHLSLMDILDRAFASRPAKDWIALFDPADVPAAICVTNSEAIQSSHAQARALHRHTEYGPILPFPVIANGLRVPNHSRAPEISSGADDILSKIGFNQTEVETLVRIGAVQKPEHHNDPVAV